VQRIAQVTTDDAYLFCNIPAFGTDRYSEPSFRFAWTAGPRTPLRAQLSQHPRRREGYPRAARA